MSVQNLNRSEFLPHLTLGFFLEGLREGYRWNELTVISRCRMGILGRGADPLARRWTYRPLEPISLRSETARSDGRR